MNKEKSGGTASYIATGGIIAAVYVLTSMLSASLGLAGGIFQIRISEALCILPVFTGAAVPGLFAGCLLTNLLVGGGVIDVVIGSLATLIGALGSRMLQKHHFLAALPPIATNTLIIPLVEIYAFNVSEGFWYLAALMFVSELISCGVLGQVLYYALRKNRKLL